MATKFKTKWAIFWLEAAAAVDTSNVLYPTGGILLCLKKVRGKDTDLAIALLHVSG